MAVIETEIGWELSVERLAEVRGVGDGDAEAFFGLGQRVAGGVERGSLAEDEDLAAGVREVRPACGLWRAGCGWWGDDDDLVGAEADLVDGGGVDEVEVVAGGEDGGG